MDQTDRQNAGSATLFRRFCMIPMGLALLSGCGGGGGGGGGIQSPPVTHDAARVGTPHSPLIWITDSNEFNAQKGLSAIQSSAAYIRGFSGREIRTAIIDSGVDSTHAEFDHPDGGTRLFAGRDWHGDSQGLADPHGHGTHVAGIIGAQRDDNGIHGVAPEAHLYSYRILSGGGNFNGRKGADMIPEIISHSNQHQIMLLNNSWASTTEITDLSKSVIANALGAELQAWETAVENGQLMVWAAGNDRDSQVSVRAGLPYHFPHLSDGWLAVVSADSEGVEPSYTNRCGVSASWCITAPGGGDGALLNGILSTQSSGGYVRKSGTSMAAPHITGGLALLLDAFPSLTPQKAAKRLLQTASYEGLETADGCRIDSCTEAEMQAVFGQGQMDIQAALQPVGALSVSDGQLDYRLENSVLQASHHLYAPLADMADQIEIVAYDSFDGAAYLTSFAEMIQPADSASVFSSVPGSVYPAPSSRRLIKIQNRQMTGFIETDNQMSSLQHQRLDDISQTADEIAAGVGFHSSSNAAQTDTQPLFSIRAGYAPSRQSAQFTAYPLTGSTELWFGGGIARNMHFLDSVGYGAWQLAQGSEKWLFAGSTIKAGRFDLTAEAISGQVEMSADSGLMRHAQADLSAFRLKAGTRLSPTIYHQLSLHQPLYLEAAAFRLAPSAVAHRENAVFSVQPAARAVALDWVLTHQLTPLWAVSYGLGVTAHAHTQTAIDESRAGLSAHIRF